MKRTSKNRVWPVVAIVEALVLLPGVAWAAIGSFSSTSSSPAVTAKSTYATGKGVYGLDTSTSTSTHYGVFGSASGTGGIGVYGSGTKNGVYSAGNLGVAAGKTLACTKCVTAADLVVMPAVSVFNPTGTNVALTDSTITPIPFASESLDTANMHPASGTTTRLTAPAKGLYLITGSAAFDQSGSGKRFLYVYKNGALVQEVSALPLDNFPTYLNVTAVLPMTAGSYVELEGYQGSGGSLSISGCTGGYCPTFTLTYLSATP